jgi:cytochrome c oxidase subunit 2
VNEWLRELLVLPEQASTYATEIDMLHYFVISVTMLGAAAVAIVATYFVIRFRRRGRPGPVPRFQMPMKIEGVLVGTLVLLFFGWWWIGLRQYMSVRSPPANTTEVYVTGKQWMFKFSYPGGKSSVGTLYVPVGQPMRLLMTSRDVIHSFYVPQFRVKQDLVPGRYTTAWFEATTPGVYEILCAEFCGTGHSQMRGQVVVLSAGDYQAWLEGASPGEGLDLVDMGEAVATDRGCLRCHTTDGSPHIGPSFAGLYGRTILLDDGGEVVADEAYLTKSMMDPLEHVRAGYRPVMPSYQGLLDPAETAALLELIRSLRAEHARPPYPPPQAEGIPVYRSPP